MTAMRPSQPRGRIGGLRAQLLLGLVLLLLLALALVAIAILQFHKRHLQQAVVDEAQRHVEMIAELNDPSRSEVSSSLRELPGVLHVGELPEGDNPPFDDSARAVITRFEGEPAVWARSDDAQVVVILSLNDAQAAVDAGRRVLFIFLLSTLLFVTVVGYGFFSFVVIRPLRALGVATRRAAQGDLASPIKVLPRNEFGDVGRQFNAMLERIDEQRAELEEQLDQLEEAHRELRQTQNSLIRSEKLASVGHLAAGIAHEVGNPLAAVLGYVELLGDRSDDKDSEQLVERTLTQLKRIRKIIRQLLDYSRQDSQTEASDVDLASCIEESLQLVRATTTGKTMEVEVDVEEELPPVHAVAGEVVQVLVNLLLNAAEAMDDGDVTEPRLRLSANSRQGAVEVDVVDNGPGVDDEIADDIFDPFFTTRDPGQGTGLGLAIAHRLVTRVDGQLELVDSPAEGAHFRILWKSADES